MQQRYSWSPRADLINIMSDVVQGLYVALDRFTQTAEGAIVQTPIYHPGSRPDQRDYVDYKITALWCGY